MNPERQRILNSERQRRYILMNPERQRILNSERQRQYIIMNPETTYSEF